MTNESWRWITRLWSTFEGISIAWFELKDEICLHFKPIWTNYEQFTESKPLSLYEPRIFCSIFLKRKKKQSTIWFLHVHFLLYITNKQKEMWFITTSALNLKWTTPPQNAYNIQCWNEQKKNANSCSRCVALVTSLIRLPKQLESQTFICVCCGKRKRRIKRQN